MTFPVRGWSGLVCFVLFTLNPLRVLSAETAASLPVASTSFVSLLQVMFGLGVVLAAIAATAWLLKRMGPGQVSSAGSMRVVGGVAVGPKERVVMVDIGETRLILGVAPGRVSVLHQMPRPQDEVQPTATDVVTGLFQGKLNQFLNKRKNASDA